MTALLTALPTNKSLAEAESYNVTLEEDDFLLPSRA